MSRFEIKFVVRYVICVCVTFIVLEILDKLMLGSFFFDFIRIFHNLACEVFVFPHFIYAIVAAAGSVFLTQLWLVKKKKSEGCKYPLIFYCVLMTLMSVLIVCIGIQSKPYFMSICRQCTNDYPENFMLSDVDRTVKTMNIVSILILFGCIPLFWMTHRNFINTRKEEK